MILEKFPPDPFKIGFVSALDPYSNFPIHQKSSKVNHASGWDRRTAS